MWEWLIIILFILLVIIRNKKRGFFWKARNGSELSFKEFMKSWKEGVEGITPLQQTKTTLWSYPLVLGGILTGIVITILKKQWWLVLILSGSLPMTLIGLLSTWQKFKQQSKIYKTMKLLERLEQAKSRLEYEEMEGTHTYTMCQCKRKSSRSYNCVLCLKEEIEKIEKELEEGK